MANEIDYTQPYVSQEEYLQAKGVDLAEELQNNDRHPNKVERFVKDLTNFVMDRLLAEYKCNELNRLTHDFSELKEWRRKRFHYGMIEEIEYVLNNGLLHQDSGVNVETGQILDFSNVVLSQSAKDQFFLGAFMSIGRIGGIEEVD